MTENTESNDRSSQWEVATLGGGCFWCLEAAFSSIKGVVKVVSGYSGGECEFPSYEQVCNGSTGHAEVVQVTFNRNILSYSDLLKVYFAIHDPTTLNRQGQDVGTQYRSVVFWHSQEQRKILDETLTALENDKVWDKPIVTESKPISTFYEAEDYHQGYYKRHSSAAYCQVTISPKLAKLRQQFASMIKLEPSQ